jgi:GAF domain-containing protein
MRVAGTTGSPPSRSTSSTIVTTLRSPSSATARAYRGSCADNRPVAALEDVLTELLETTGAGRVTLRRDLPGESAFPVVAEALAPGVGSLRGERSVHLPTQPVVLEVQAGRQVVQDDSAAAYDDAAFQRMLAVYGGLAAQIVTPVLRAGRVEAILSIHQLGTPRRWTAAEVASASRAAERIGALL